MRKITAKSTKNVSPVDEPEDKIQSDSNDQSQVLSIVPMNKWCSLLLWTVKHSELNWSHFFVYQCKKSVH